MVRVSDRILSKHVYSCGEMVQLLADASLLQLTVVANWQVPIRRMGSAGASRAGIGEQVFRDAITW